MDAHDEEERLEGKKIAATDGEHVRFGKALGTRRMLPSSATGGAFGLVEHDLPAGQLGSPVHTHEREDEYSYVLSGRLTAQVGDDVIEAEPGELVVKPRGIPHAFWNAGSEAVRFLELICPGGFEEYFFELAAPFNARDAEAMDEIRRRYRLDLRMETIPELLERNGLQPLF
jgi:quercetin dioxygenase-like cupin family protein